MNFVKNLRSIKNKVGYWMPLLIILLLMTHCSSEDNITIIGCDAMAFQVLSENELEFEFIADFPNIENTTYSWYLDDELIEQDGNTSEFLSDNMFSTTIVVPGKHEICIKRNSECIGISNDFCLDIDAVSTANRIVHIRKQNAPEYALEGGDIDAGNQDITLQLADPSNVDQHWEEIDRGNGYYSYKKLNSNFSIAGGEGGTNGQEVKLRVSNDTNENTHWLKVRLDNNTYRLEKRNAPNFSIDGNNGAEIGRTIYLWTNGHGPSSENSNQQWLFEVVGVIE